MEYLLTSQFHLIDRLVRGEIIRIFIDAPYQMTSDDQIRFNFIVGEGVSFPITAFTGHTIPASEYVRLYPKI